MCVCVLCVGWNGKDLLNFESNYLVGYLELVEFCSEHFLGEEESVASLNLHRTPG